MQVWARGLAAQEGHPAPTFPGPDQPAIGVRGPGVRIRSPAPPLPGRSDRRPHLWCSLEPDPCAGQRAVWAALLCLQLLPAAGAPSGNVSVKFRHHILLPLPRAVECNPDLDPSDAHAASMHLTGWLHKLQQRPERVEECKMQCSLRRRLGALCLLLS